MCTDYVGPHLCLKSFYSNITLDTSTLSLVFHGYKFSFVIYAVIFTILYISNEICHILLKFINSFFKIIH